MPVVGERSVRCMCTDHQRHAHPGATTITRVPLARVHRPPRLTRRHLLVRAALGTASIAVVAACGSDPASTAVPSSSPSSSSSSTADISSSPETTDANPETAASDELQLQHVSLGFVSAYVLVRGREAAIVDTGTAGSGAAITQALTDLGLSPADVRHIILTHNHGDHIGGLGELEQEMTNAQVYAGEGDIDTIRSSLDLTQIGDGDEVFGMGVVGTPGHTVGSVSVFDTDTGLVVAGDAINGDNEGGLTGANPDFTPDMDTATLSVAKLAALMPRVAAFGHGGPPVSEDVAAKLAAIS